MFQTLLKNSTVPAAASATLALAIAWGPVWAEKPAPETPVLDDVTGCLDTKNGRLRLLDEGDTPLKKCNKQEAIVTLNVVGLNEVEPFSFAMDNGESVVIVESIASGPATSFTVDCAPGSVMLTADGDIINGAEPEVDLVGTSENDLPVLLDDDQIVYSLHGVRAFANPPYAECVVIGVVQRSVLEFVE